MNKTLLSLFEPLLFKLEYIKTFHWEKVKWVSSMFFLAGTLIMLSPSIAALSILPWVFYMVGNAIWMVDSMIVKNKPWVWMAGFFVIWNIVLILSRVYSWGIGG